MTTLIALPFVVLAVVYIFVYLAIVARHAIPRAPVAFHFALTAPMFLGIGLLFTIAALVETGADAKTVVNHMTGFVWTEIAWLSVLLFYSYWWYRHGRNERAAQLDRIERFASEAASERTGDRPREETDRSEGREHRSVIEETLQDDREERAEERQLDREERAQERQDDRDERRDERNEE